MPRYVEIDDVEVSDYVTVWDCNCSEFGKQTVVAVDDLQYLPTADVVPKSEVDRLNAVMKEMDEQRAYTINMLGESLEKAKSEVENIFAEIETCMKDFEDDDDGYLLKKCEFEFFMREIKEKYAGQKNG